MDGTEKQGDALQSTAGQPLPGEPQGTSGSKAKTYTEDEFNTRLSDALAAKGRDDKTLSDREATLNSRQEGLDARQAEIAEQERQRDAEELEVARIAATKGDSEPMKIYQDKKTQRKLVDDIGTQRGDVKKEREALDRDKAEHAAEIKAARETQMEIKIFEIATRENVDPQKLKDLNLPTVEQIEAVAKVLPKLPAKGEDETPEGLSVDSGVTSGGQGEPTKEQLEKMPMAQYAAYAEKRDAKK